MLTPVPLSQSHAGGNFMIFLSGASDLLQGGIYIQCNAMQYARKKIARLLKTPVSFFTKVCLFCAK